MARNNDESPLSTRPCLLSSTSTGDAMQQHILHYINIGMYTYIFEKLKKSVIAVETYKSCADLLHYAKSVIMPG